MSCEDGHAVKVSCSLWENADASSTDNWTFTQTPMIDSWRPGAAITTHASGITAMTGFSTWGGFSPKNTGVDRVIRV
jgi:hypothetical protein